MASDRGQNRYSDFVALETLLRFEKLSVVLVESVPCLRVAVSLVSSFFGAPLVFFVASLLACIVVASRCFIFVFVSSDLPFVECLGT